MSSKKVNDGRIPCGELSRALGLNKARSAYWRRRGLLPKQVGNGRGAYYRLSDLLDHLGRLLTARAAILQAQLKLFLKTKKGLSK